MKKEFSFLEKDKIQVSASYKTHIQFVDTQKLRAKSWKRINSIDNKIKLVLQLHNNVKEKAMAFHSSTLAWKIPWMEEPGRLQSMVLLRVGHD